MDLEISSLFIRGIFFGILVFPASIIFNFVFHHISHLCTRLCIYHKAEDELQRLTNLFFVNLKLSVAFFLVVYVIFGNALTLKWAFVISAAIAFVILTASRLMAITEWHCPRGIDMKTENERAASNVFSIIIAAITVSLSIVAYNVAINPTTYVTDQLSLSISFTWIEGIVLLLLYLANVLAMSISQSLLTVLFPVPDTIQRN